MIVDYATPSLDADSGMGIPVCLVSKRFTAYSPSPHALERPHTPSSRPASRAMYPCSKAGAKPKWASPRPCFEPYLGCRMPPPQHGFCSFVLGTFFEVQFKARMGIRVAYGGGLEDCSPIYRGVGSNPTPSAEIQIRRNRSELFIFPDR